VENLKRSVSGVRNIGKDRVEVGDFTSNPQSCLQAHQTLWFATVIDEEIPFLPARIELSLFL